MHVQGKRGRAWTQLVSGLSVAQRSGSVETGTAPSHPWLATPSGRLRFATASRFAPANLSNRVLFSSSLSARTLKAPIRGLLGFWRRERDSNPRRASNPYSLSRGALSTAQPSLLLTAGSNFVPAFRGPLRRNPPLAHAFIQSPRSDRGAELLLSGWCEVKVSARLIVPGLPAFRRLWRAFRSGFVRISLPDGRARPWGH